LAVLYRTFSSQRNPKGLFGESRICEGKGDPFDKLRTGFRVCVYGREVGGSFPVKNGRAKITKRIKV
jgi:hypothetical protein